MRCYYCMEQKLERHAVALCRWCGAAVCCEHVLEVQSSAELVVRMAKPLATRREFVCFLCWEDHRPSAAPASSPQRQQVVSHEDTLLDAANAVRLAEAFLRHEYSHHPGKLRSRLQALRLFLVTRLHLAWLIPPAGVPSRRERI